LCSFLFAGKRKKEQKAEESYHEIINEFHQVSQ